MNNKKEQDMSKTTIIIITFIILVILTFWLGGFRFSTAYLIGRNIPFDKLDEIKCVWKYSGGYSIGYDGFNKKDCKITNDTLYLYDKPVAKTISLVSRFLIDDYELTIKSFDGKNITYYVSK